MAAQGLSGGGAVHGELRDRRAVGSLRRIESPCQTALGTLSLHYRTGVVADIAVVAVNIAPICIDIHHGLRLSEKLH